MTLHISISTSVITNKYINLLLFQVREGRVQRPFVLMLRQVDFVEIFVVIFRPQHFAARELEMISAETKGLKHKHSSYEFQIIYSELFKH